MTLSMWKKLFAGQRIHFWVLSNVVVALDQLTKIIFVGSGEMSYRITLVPGILNILPADLNPKGAFSLGPEGATFYIVASFIGLAIIGWFMVTTPPDHRTSFVALGCLFGGALGNLIDRVILGGVRDFIDLHWGPHHWPTFNVADMGICVGVGLLLWEVFFHPAEDASEA